MVDVLVNEGAYSRRDVVVVVVVVVDAANVVALLFCSGGYSFAVAASASTAEY